MSDSTHDSAHTFNSPRPLHPVGREPSGHSQPPNNDQKIATIRSLGPRDVEVLDALLAARATSGGNTAASLPPESVERAARLSRLLSLLEQDTCESPPSDLVSRTMARCREDRQRARFAKQVQMLAEPRRTAGLGWRQCVTAAGLLLMGFALLMPMLKRSRADAQRLTCASNLATAGLAFTTYAADNRGVLPRGPIRPGDVWWNVGEPNHSSAPYVHSNSAHLYLLIRGNYASPQELTCPANPNAHPAQYTPKMRDWPTPAEVSYSYQNQYTPQPVRLNRHNNLALLADRNPLFVSRAGKMAFDAQCSTSRPSRSHQNRGQNVLRSNGAVTWTVRPTVRRGRLGDDNIWVVTGIRKYQGNEKPLVAGDQIDNFLVP